MQYSSLKSLRNFFDSSVKGLNYVSLMQLRTDMICPLILLQETLAGLTKLILAIHFILFFLFKFFIHDKFFTFTYQIRLFFIHTIILR